MTSRLRLAGALLVSITLHALLVAAIRVWYAGAAPVPGRIEIDLASVPPPIPAPAGGAPAPPAESAAVPPPLEPEPPALTLPERQIVSPSEAGEEKAPSGARFLSDRDNTVREQSVRRGEPAKGEDSPPQPVRGRESQVPSGSASGGARAGHAGRAAPSGAAAREQARTAALEDLLPGAARLAGEEYASAGGARLERLAKAEAPERRDLLKHGDPWGSGRGGTLDFLPDVREGDITLLNTKAELFAPFVRRVGMRVFQNLIILLRRDLASARSATDESVTMEAVMNRKGEMIDLQFKERSAVASFGTDRSLQRACQEAFFDRNPPAGAEMADGNIHFLLNTRVAVIAGPDGRAAGYRAIFSIGLL